MKHDILAHPIYIFGDYRIIDELCLPIDLRGQLGSLVFVVCARAAKEVPSREAAKTRAVMAREKLFMLQNLQIQERWSNQKKLKASSDGPEIVSQTNCENVQSRKRAEGRG